MHIFELYAIFMQTLNDIFSAYKLSKSDIDRLSNEAKAASIDCGKKGINKQLPSDTWDLFDEISDKVKVTESIEKFEVLFSKANWDAFSSSIFPIAAREMDNFLEAKSSISLEQKKLKRRINSFVVPDAGFFGFNSAANRNAKETLAKMNLQLNQVTDKINAMESTHEVNRILSEINEKLPEYERVQNRVLEIESGLLRKYAIDLNSILNQHQIRIPADLMPFFEKACKLVIRLRGASVSILIE